MEDTGRTKVWAVHNLAGHHLGEVRWWTAWRRYTFASAPGAFFDAGCLLELSDFLDFLQIERDHVCAICRGQIGGDQPFRVVGTEATGLVHWHVACVPEEGRADPG